MRRVRKPKESPAQTRFLSDDEPARLLTACRASTSRHLYTSVVLALSTGCWKNEMLKLRWSQVDLQAGRIRLETTKNGHPRTAPVTGLAWQLPRALPRGCYAP